MSDRAGVSTASDSSDGEPVNGGISRRAALSATAAGLTIPTSGCIRQIRSAINRDGVDPLSLTITTLPADGDRESIRLAREIAAALEAAGIDTAIEMRSNEEFLRSVLLNHDFDVYVGRHPGDPDPDFLYETLHSTYADESGWQNPFGFTNLLVDERLEEQRAAEGDERADAVESVLEALALEQPFVPICRPIEHRLARADRFDGWTDGHLSTRTGYLGLDTQREGSAEQLRTVYTDARPSQNLNPLNAEYRDRGTITDLLYDPLAADVFDAGAEGDLEPWLAEEWTFDGGTLAVELRPELTFHDGEELTADDVVFTYEFLADTARGDGSGAAPSPRYRGRVAAVEAVTRVDDTALEFEMATGEDAAERALTVPILPEHVWEGRSGEATVRGVRIAQGTTEALTTDNVPAVGSGPFQFADRTDREHLTLERFGDHVTLREDVDLPEPTVDELRVQIDPRSTSAIQLVEDDDADVTSTPLESYVVDDIDVEETDDLTLLESPTWSFYHLGFNTRKAPFGNPRFRQVVAELIDEAWLAEEVFHGYAEPIATPVTEEWTPDELAWDDGDPATAFLGADGEVDVDAAREAFEDAGFRYDGDGNLRVRHY
ncbi:ABC transporter substrate-binding protein [Natronolimnohabitans innermongolicus]|uniref:Family 5 extracellular solute-binding protein n=1 Tax=Natronolimnohabitans innermongolicus JCM 12255 TaxID=1227499 RepID=L9XHL5_9EURY|nr:ABC transporter substrate-binding protein [Natronolimnohabitans innermongolicus]ELY61234.1 family 5 extracellular solute-binding protein [Natronolimnohabitans innermongolicus JCM 12255]